MRILLTCFLALISLVSIAVDSSGKTIKVVVLAGDESVLDQGIIKGTTDGIHDDFYPNPTPVKGEKKKHVNVLVYKGSFSAETNYDELKPDAEGLVELGEQRTRRKFNKKRGREPVPMTPFPDLSNQTNTTTVLQGYLTVKTKGNYAFQPGSGESSFNITYLGKKVVYRKERGAESPTITPIELAPGKRYAFKTTFYGKPGHDFRVVLLNKPGTLETVVTENPRYAFLKEDGKWVTRDDVVLYDAHPIHNNNKTIGHKLQVGDVVYGGEKPVNRFGPELMLGHVLGNAWDEPVLIIRFGTYHPIWFQRGSRSLGHDYLPPSSGGTVDHEGNWDVIHFNWGVWDSQYREKSFKFYEGDGKHPTSYEDYEENLRTLVARMKKTGATLIWASVTPVWEGEPGKPNADVKKYNAIAEAVMRENGVIIDDLHAESLRQGFPKTTNVHSVGNLAPKVTETVLKALKDRKNPTKPLPRVLFIGDSITGSYIKQTMKNLDGKAFVCKNPGNGESTWNGLRRIDQWLDLKRYILNGQEYMELVDGVNGALSDLSKVYPGYNGQKAELAGLIWFQGIKDSQSDAMADAYESNLVNLIPDLRKAFNAPNLPVVVTALGYGGDKPDARLAKVMNAQLAVGNHEKYPQFKGNVRSIDTCPFNYPAIESPDGRPQDYKSNAKSYLEIGKAVGNALLELNKD